MTVLVLGVLRLELGKVQERPFMAQRRLGLQICPYVFYCSSPYDPLNV